MGRLPYIILLLTIIPLNQLICLHGHIHSTLMLMIEMGQQRRLAKNIISIELGSADLITQNAACREIHNYDCLKLRES